VFNHSHPRLSELARAARLPFELAFILPKSPGAKALLAANVFFAALLAAEIWSGAGAPPPENPIIEQPSQYTTAGANGKSSPAADHLAELPAVAAKITARPLFARDRRQHEPVAQMPIVTEPPVRLVGTIVSGHVRIAFLELGEQRVTRGVGESVRNAIVIEIDPGLVRLQTGFEKVDNVWLSQGTRIEPPSQPAAAHNWLRE
jgi:hypothetical protein